MRLLTFLAMALLGGSVWAQVEPQDDLAFEDEGSKVEVEIGCGDTAIIGVSSLGVGSEFAHIDAIRKTRWPDRPLAYDTATGKGLYASFFGSGDFNLAKLPASYAGRYLVILGVDRVPLKTKNSDGSTPWAEVLFLEADIPNTVFWVDFNAALSSGEIQEFRANWALREEEDQP
ncbi:MAG: hypothetical protein RL577_1303 [Bacteroidota bacterium]|jgi:hypothetical protein